MNPFEMVAIIVAVVMIATVLKSRYRYQHRVDDSDPAERAEAIRLRDEVKQLKERIHVLERIATEKENSLAREIDDLRDR